MANWMKHLTVFLVMLGAITMVFGMYVYDNGFHTIDIAQNMKYLNAEFDLDLIDKTLQGTLINSTDAYGLGIWQSRAGLLIFGLGCFIFGSSISDVLTMLKENDKK
jgi:hypothetical protein